MADDRVYTFLKYVAVSLALAIVAWAIYDKFADRAPGDSSYHQANTLFEDGAYERAANSYRAALFEAPDHLFALRGLARSLHLAGHVDEAQTIYDEAIAAEPRFAATYANRGILLDSLGHHEDALADYDQALALDPELADGPAWLTRFLRNQAEAPSTIADRAGYLRVELARPEADRVLSLPDIDAAQRPYKQ